MGAALVAATSLPLFGGGAAVVAQGNDWTGSLIASDGWRVEVVAAAQGPSVGDAGLDRRDSGAWVLVVADVTNWTGDAAAFPTDDVSVGAGDTVGGAVEGTVLTDLNLREGPSIDALILTGMPAGATVTVTGEAVDGFYPVIFDGLEGYASVDGVSVDGEPAAAGGAIDLDASGDAADELSAAALGDDIDADATVRLAMAFAVGDGAEDVALQFGSALPLTDALDAGTDLTALAEVTEPTLTEVEVDSVNDDGTVALADGTDLTLTGSRIPDRGTCFADTAVDELDDLTSGTVSFEAAGGDSTGYLWAEDGGARSLVNYTLIGGGFAQAEFGDGQDRVAEAWFTATRDQARDDETGLWSECDGFNGDERPEPTVAPTATPDAAEIRGEYPVLADVRELEIRTGNFVGDQVAFSGQVFTIFVASPGNAYYLGPDQSIEVTAVLQIDVIGPDGAAYAIFVGYDGDTAGIFDGTYVTVYGTVEGIESFTNGFGAEISDPLVIADIIDIA